MSYEIEYGKCCICKGSGPRDDFAIVSIREAFDRFVQEGAGTKGLNYWPEAMHDSNLGIEENQAMVCPPGQHRAFRYHNGCPGWELNEDHARIYWNLDARHRGTKHYVVQKSRECTVSCASCIHSREVRDIILNPKRLADDLRPDYAMGCAAGYDTNPDRVIFASQLSRKRYNIYDPPRDAATGAIIPPADDEPLFILGADPTENVYLWQFSCVDLIVHHESLWERGERPARWEIRMAAGYGPRKVGDPAWATVFALMNLGVPHTTGMDFDEERAAVAEWMGVKNVTNGWVRRKVNRLRKRIGLAEVKAER